MNNEGREFADPLSVLLAHFFNHQTHHHGQVTAMLSQTEVTYPVLDMHRVLIPEPGLPVSWPCRARVRRELRVVSRLAAT